MEKLTSTSPKIPAQEASGQTGTSSSSSQTPLVGMPLAPPRTPPDQASLQSSMDKNKETLKRKLMLRRSVNELVDRGIYPPLKTPPAFAEKTKQLERAKTGDILRHKIQHRPDRQALVQQHILEDTTIDPSLHERQRLLKRSRLLDGLNDKLAHRPGPLELVQGNILQPSNELVNAIKDGTLQFVPTCDTEDMDQSSSSNLFEDESDGAQSPQMDESSDVSSPSSAPPVPSGETFPISFTFAKGISIPVAISKSPVTTNSTALTKLSSSQPAGGSGLINNINSHTSSGKPRSKKLKPKATSKARIIKFHEYKGPPSVVKSQTCSSSAAISSTGSTEDTPYHIMLQQQQLFLQWQLEFQQKQQQQGVVALSPGGSNVGENSNSSTGSSMLLSSPVIPTSNTCPTFIQSTSASTPSLITLQHSQAQASTTPAVFVQSSAPSHRVSPSPPTPPPPPPLPPTRPTQSVAPRTLAKTLTSIPASALSLPKLTGNLEEMKVADLKAELKKRSLPVSGPKPQLIERLKPFTESNSVGSKSNTSPASHHVSTPMQFKQATFEVKAEPNGEVPAVPITRSISSSTTSLLVSPATYTSPNSLLVSSGSYSSNNSLLVSSGASMPVSLPLTTLGLKTVASVKPMIKEEPMTTTEISPPNSPLSFTGGTQGPRTPMTPEFDVKPSSTFNTKGPALGPQSLLKSSSFANGQLIINTSPISLTQGQTVVSMNADQTRPASVLPAEMMPMEVDSVSVDLNQGVDDMAFKAASMCHSLDSVGFKALIQPMSNNAYKAVSLSQGSLENNPVKINTSLIDTNNIKTINLSPNFDGSTSVKTVSLSPNSDPATMKTVNLGTSSDMSAFKTLNLCPNADGTGFKAINVSPSSEGTSLLKTMKVPLPQLSPTHVSPVQFAAPLTHSLTSPTSLLQLQQLQQLQTLHHLQQQLLQQTQAHQQFQQQALQQSNQVSLTANDHVVLAQAKQIEELQRQLQESHLKLKLQQLQQQQMQLQQQQQQMWQVRIPSTFAQNSLLSKLSQDQLSLPQQIGQMLTTPVQQATLQPSTSVHPTSLFLNGHGLQQAAPSVQQSPPIVSSSSSINGVNVGSNDTNLLNMVTSGQPAVSLPYAIHINLTSSALPAQLQPITTSTSTKPLQLLTAVKSEPGTSHAMGPPSTSTVPKSQVSTGQATVVPATPTSTALITGHSNGLISRAASLPSSPLVADQQQKMNIQRCTSNPYFSGPLKEPPRYDEAIKIKQQQTVPSLNNNKLIICNTNVNNNLDKPIGLGQMEPQVKSQTMDDVLEILIRNGDLPPSAATEPLPTPKISQPSTLSHSSGQTTLSQSSGQTTLSHSSGQTSLSHSSGQTSLSQSSGQTALSQSSGKTSLSQSSGQTLTLSQSISQPLSTSQPSSQPVSLPQPSIQLLTQSPSSGLMSNVSVTLSPDISLGQIHRTHLPTSTSNHQAASTSPRDQTLTSIHTNISSPPNADLSSSSSLNLNDGTSHSDGGELLDWGEMLPSPDLSAMDWSSEPGFGHLDLGDSSLNLESKRGDNPVDSRYSSLLQMDNMSPMCRSGSRCELDNGSGLRTPSGHGSEPDLSALGLGGDLGDAVDPSSQMDMSDWLDVIMPNHHMSTHHPIAAPSSISFSADPILTPRTQQEVFDIFNFDDPDFGPSAMSWDKLAEQGTSS